MKYDCCVTPLYRSAFSVVFSLTRSKKVPKPARSTVLAAVLPLASSPHANEMRGDRSPWSLMLFSDLGVFAHPVEEGPKAGAQHRLGRRAALGVEPPRQRDAWR